jgi:hypothetical protein
MSSAFQFHTTGRNQTLIFLFNLALVVPAQSLRLQYEENLPQEVGMAILLISS